MKTKIIYISGSELFEMSEIRAAFDEVRETLGLDNKTILFGVPVDSDDALPATETVSTTQNIDAVIDTAADTVLNDSAQPEEIYNAVATEQIETIEEIPDVVSDVIIDAPPETNAVDSTEIMEEAIEGVEAVSQSAELYAQVADTDIEPQDIAEQQIDAKAQEIPQNENNTIIPILSLLGTKEGQDEQPTEINQTSDNTVSTTEEVAQDYVELEKDSKEIERIEQVSISDIADEEPPVKSTKKTIEELLESMTPLREDYNSNTTQETIDSFDVVDMSYESDTDATLAQLASEFAENEDKIPQQKTEAHGKIGKLKNILPFKKAKRDDSSLIGDLFGWAGIAANDEEFSIPGFFANAKKQGA